MKYTLIPVFLLILLLKMKLELILLLRMNCYRRSYPEWGIKRIIVLLICIMWCKTIMSSSIPHKSKMTINRGRKLFLAVKKFVNTPLPNLFQTSNSSKLSIPLHQKNQLKTLLQRKKTVLSRAIGKRKLRVTNLAHCDLKVSRSQEKSMRILKA